VALLVGGWLTVACATAQEAPGPQTVPTQPEATAKVVLEADTPIRLRLVAAVTSKRAKAGDRVAFQVMEDVTVDGLVVIPRHAIAWGTISQAQPSRMLGRGGKLAIELNSVAALTGEQVALCGAQGEKGEFAPILGDAVVAAATVVLLPALPFVKGDQAVIPKGTVVTALVKSRVSLDQARLVAENRVLEERLKSQPPRVPGKAVVSIYRTLPREEEQGIPHDTLMIRLDGDEAVGMREGRFVTIELDPGEHTFTADENELKLRLEKDAEYYLKINYVKVNLYDTLELRRQAGTISEEEYRKWSRAEKMLRDISFHKPVLEVVSSEKGDLEMFPLARSSRRDIKNHAVVVVESPLPLATPR